MHVQHGQGLPAINAEAYPSHISQNPITCSKFLDHIIDKKVHEIALTCLEKLAHFICYIFYCNYRRIIDARILSFPNGGEAKLYDQTRENIVKIATQYTLQQLRAQFGPKSDYIVINGRYVEFPQPHNALPPGTQAVVGVKFGTREYTKSVHVQSDPDNNHMIHITEYQTNNLPPNHWTVDLRIRPDHIRFYDPQGNVNRVPTVPANYSHPPVPNEE